MNKNTFSYKQGFKKGIEIYNKNASQGYYKDEDNERAMKRCKQYADTGYKDNQPLRQTQIEFYYGMYDGIRYSYKQKGVSIKNEKYSKFENHEKEKHYGKKSHYDGFGFYD
jgi:hypothetical protein